MGNSLLRFFGGGDDKDDYRYSDFHRPRRYSVSLVNHEVTQATSGLAAIVNDLLITSQVPEGLSSHVDASEKQQANSYEKLVEAWKEETPAPKTRLAAATLVARTLRRNRKEDIQDVYELQSGISSTPAWPKGVRSMLRTLPVDANAVTDRDRITVYEDTAAADVPVDVKEATNQWTIAQAEKNNKKAKALLKGIRKAGYRATEEPNGKVTLTRKHRIRLRHQKLVEAWKEETPAPKTRLAAATLLARTLWRNRKEDIQDVYELQSGISSTPAWPKGVRSMLRTLPVDANAVTDGDGITVYVDTAAADVPVDVKEVANQWTIARAKKNNKKAKALLKRIKEAGYRAIEEPNGKLTLARKHRIRLRGIDAPEGPQPFGEEAKEGLCKLTKGKSLEIHVYNKDRFGRLVGDVYCNGIFVQEQMLRRGLAMHYASFDKRPEFAEWQRKAKAKCRGLWALPDPEKPWKWRKRNKGWRDQVNAPVQVN